MRTRFLVLSLPLALLLVASCAHRPVVPPLPDDEEEVVILLEPDKAALPKEGLVAGETAIGVTPLRARLRWPRQKVVWISSDSDDTIVSIVFLRPGHPNPICGEGRRCEVRFEPGRPGRYPYRVTIQRGETRYVKNAPDLIIDF